MGASDAVTKGDERGGGGGGGGDKGGGETGLDEGEEEEKREKQREAGEKDEAVEEEEVVVVVDSPSQKESRVSRLQTHHPVAPIQVVPRDDGVSAATHTARSAFQPPHPPPLHAATPPLSVGVGGATPTTAAATLNARGYTNRISLFLFVLHLVVAAAAICFFSYKAVQVALGGGPRQRKERRVLAHWLPPIEGSAVLSIALAFAWQKLVRLWPTHLTVRAAIWASSFTSLAAGVLLLCFSIPATVGVGVALITFSVGNGLYACWVTGRTAFTAQVLSKSLHPAAKFRGINGPAYLMMAAGFLWISLWCFAVIGALNFYYSPATVLALVLSLMWTAEVLRNVANLTVSRVVALYYLRGMQSNVQFCFHRALTHNLGSACLGSLFVPAIEACRIIARALNLLEGEDEFLFSCAHCCLHVMESIFRYGNSWAFVHIAAYGRGFVEASQSTWGLFERQGLEPVVDADITSSICFLTGVTSGSLCVIFAAAWTYSDRREFTATVSLLAFFVGYLMTRIGMALPQACVGCYYVCYAENPGSRLFDSTIPDRLQLIRSGRDVPASTPRVPRRFNT